MNADRACIPLSAEVTLRFADPQRLAEEFEAILVRSTAAVVAGLARIADEHAALRGVLERAFLRSPNAFHTNDRLGPGFE